MRSGANPWLLAAGDAGGTVTIWDLGPSRVRSFCRGSRYDVYAITFSPDGTILASGGRREVRLWEVNTGRVLLVLEASPGIEFVSGLAFSPDGSQLAVASLGGFNIDPQVLAWDLESGRGVQTLFGLNGQVSKVCFSNDGRHLAALSHNWQVAAWDVGTGRLRDLWDAPKGAVADNAALALHPDGSRFACASGAEAKLWDTTTGEELASWEFPSGLVDCMAFHHSGKLLLFRVETETGKPPYSSFPWKEHPRVCRVRELIEPDRAVVLYEKRDFPRHVGDAEAPLDAAYFVVDGHGGGDGTQRLAKVFDALTGEELWSTRLQLPDHSAAISLDARGEVLRVYMGSDTGTALLAMPSGRLLGMAEAALDGPGAAYWANNTERGLLLYRRGEQTPVVTLD